MLSSTKGDRLDRICSLALESVCPGGLFNTDLGLDGPATPSAGVECIGREGRGLGDPAFKLLSLRRLTLAGVGRSMPSELTEA